MQMFADAIAVDCSHGWDPPSPTHQNKYLCQQDYKGGVLVHYCGWCGRYDKNLPSASNCYGPHGRPMDTTGSLSCEAGMVIDKAGNPDRPIICKHKDNNGVLGDYRCATWHLSQQCPLDTCHR